MVERVNRGWIVVEDSGPPSGEPADAAWAPPLPPASQTRTPESPDLLPGYDRAEQIARGADSVVYRARHRALNRLVAVKVLLVDDPSTIARFERELELTVRLGHQHPHIVTVLDSGFTPEGQPCIVMEYLERGSLGDQLKDHGPLPSADVLRIARTLADALAFAHSEGVLHRDVKPQNVLVLPTSWVLADFGISRLADSDSTASVEHFSYRHAAPQVLDGQPPTAADDIWSLGSTLFTLLDGRPPFASEDPADDTALAYLRRARTEEPRVLDRPDAPPGLLEVIERCLIKDPSGRWPDAASLGEALARVESEALGWAPDPGPASPPVDEPAPPPERAPGRAPEPGPASVPGSVPASVGAPVPATEPPPEPAVALEPQPGPEPGLDAEPEPDPEPAVALEPEPEPEPGLDAEPGPELEPETGPDTATAPEREPEPEATPEARPEAAAEPEPAPAPAPAPLRPPARPPVEPASTFAAAAPAVSALAHTGTAAHRDDEPTGLLPSEDATDGASPESALTPDEEHRPRRRTSRRLIVGGLALGSALGIGVALLGSRLGEQPPAPSPSPTSHAVPSLSLPPSVSPSPEVPVAVPALAPLVLDARGYGTRVELEWSDPSEGKATFVIIQTNLPEPLVVAQFPPGTTSGGVEGVDPKADRVCYTVGTILGTQRGVSPERCLDPSP